MKKISLLIVLCVLCSGVEILAKSRYSTNSTSRDKVLNMEECVPINPDVWQALDKAVSRTQYGNPNKWSTLELHFYDASTYEGLDIRTKRPEVPEDSINVNSDFFVLIFSNKRIESYHDNCDLVRYGKRNYIPPTAVRDQLTKRTKSVRITPVGRKQKHNAYLHPMTLLRWDSLKKIFTEVKLDIDLGLLYFIICE